MKKVIHIVGSGTIGLPLIHMFARFKDKFGFDEVTFHKNTPLKTDITSVKQLLNLGVKFSTDEDKFDGFRNLGAEPSFNREEAIERASVVIDCTPSGKGISNKEKYYSKYSEDKKRFIFQGSENGAGVKFAAHITDLDPEEKFVQVVSCNTHNIAALLMAFNDSGAINNIHSGDFVCMRRANDISQDGGFVPSPTAERVKDEVFGSHHAADAHALLSDILPHTKLYSTALKLNTQYMHAIRFSIEISRDVTRQKVVDQFDLMSFAALTEKCSANKIFSFGREHGFFGRILNQAVICAPTIDVQKTDRGSLIRGVSFTSQDGNSLLSSVYAAIQYIHPETVIEKMSCLSPYIFTEI